MRNIYDSSGKRNPLLAIDLETRKHESAIDYIEKDRVFNAPAHYKDEVAIQRYIKNAKEKELAKAALNIPTHRIWVACLGDVRTGETHTVAHVDERELVCELFNLLDSKFKDHTLFGFNTRSFDFPALCGAALRCGVKVPKHFIKQNKLSDILDDFYHIKMRLADIAYIIGEKKLMDGASVADEWRAHCIGDDKAQGRVIEYCKQDVRICMEYVRRVYP